MATETHPDDGPGKVVISASTVGSAAGEIILRGRDSGDRFGEDVAILNDLTGNGCSRNPCIVDPCAGACTG